MESLATKSLGTHKQTGLPLQANITSLNISAKNETVTVSYDVVVLDKEGNVFQTLSRESYTRKNLPEEVQRGALMTLGKSTESKVLAASMKFDALKNSSVGQAIMAMLAADLEAFDGTPESLEQKRLIKE